MDAGGVREPPEAAAAGAGFRPGHAAARRAAAAQCPPRARRRLRRRGRRRHGQPGVLGGVVRLEVERLVGVVPAGRGAGGARPQQDPAVRGAAAVVPYPQAVGGGAERRGEKEDQQVHARDVGAAPPPAGAGAAAARSRRRSVVRHGLDLERRGCGGHGHEAEETGEH